MLTVAGNHRHGSDRYDAARAPAAGLDLTLWLHRAASAAQVPAYLRFVRALGRVEATQRRVLRRLLRQAAGTETGRRLRLGEHLSYEQLAARLPVSGFEDWRAAIEAQRAAPARRVLCPSCRRFEPTSGSTAGRKWIPYPPAFVAELDAAIGPWLFDLARRYPATMAGRHYWSLSWLPDELRQQAGATSDDLQLLPWYKRALQARLMAAPAGIAFLPSMEQALLATVTALAACADLTLVSVWSPTFALQALRLLAERRAEVAARLAASLDHVGAGAPLAGGRGPASPRDLAARAALLRGWDGQLTPALTRRLWPRLALVSAWDSSSSAPFAAELRALLPHAAFQPKGLWATEGAVSFPFRGQQVAAITSHLLEWRELDGGRVLPSWGLRTGMAVQPVLSTASGLWRYALWDRPIVTGHLGQAPCLRFEGRLGGVDLVGEKLDRGAVAQLLDVLSARSGLRCVSLIGGREPGAGRASYTLLVQAPGVHQTGPVSHGPAAAQGAGAPERATRLAAEAEARLGEFHHYQVAVRLGQLGPLRVELATDVVAAYARLVTGDEACGGAVKIEPLALARRAAGGSA